LNSLSTLQAEKWGIPVSLRTVLCRIGLGVAVVTAVGCAAVVPRTAEMIVKERAQARWDALLKGDSKAAYGYMSPGSRSVVTEKDYAASIREGFWKAAVVDGVECGAAQSCDALVTIEYEYLGRRTKTPLRETWIREGSDWWYLRK
jgi:nucleoside phosphorylase